MGFLLLLFIMSTTILINRVIQDIYISQEIETIIILLSNYLIIIENNKVYILIFYIIIFFIIFYSLLKKYYLKQLFINNIKLSIIFINMKKYLILSKFIIIIQTIICILACDFKIFPNIHRKTKYGLSLMDTGIGFFIILDGFNITPNLLKNIKVIIGNIILGIIRMIIIKSLKGLKNDYEEYNLFYNGYFLMACLKILFCIFKCWNTSWKKFFFFFIISNFIYPFLLLFNKHIYFLPIWILINGLCLMIISFIIKKLIYENKNKQRISIINISLIYLLTIFIFLISNSIILPNRKYLNISYTSSVLLLYLSVGCFSLLFQYNELKIPFVCYFINKNALKCFLISNLFVLLANYFFNLWYWNLFIFHLLMGFYLFSIYNIL